MSTSRDVYSLPLHASFADTSFAVPHRQAYASADEYDEPQAPRSRDPSPPPSRTALPQTEAVTERTHWPLGHAGGLTPRGPGDDKAKTKGAHPRLDKFLQGF